MKVEFYGFESGFPRWERWYTRGYTGIKVLGKRFLGISIYYNLVVVDIKTFRSKPSVGIWLYIFFYNIHIEIKDCWKDEDVNSKLYKSAHGGT
jgi:hypothetical protein